MIDFAEQIRDIYHKLGRQEKIFFGGPPYSEGINKELENAFYFSLLGPANRKREAIATCEFRDVKAVGYQASTIMKNANPSKYEQEFIGLNKPFSYVQLKKILVDPDYWGKGIADDLLLDSFDAAVEFSFDWVVDVNAKNVRMLAFLKKRGVEEKFSWMTPKGTEMLRLGIDYNYTQKVQYSNF